MKTGTTARVKPPPVIQGEIKARRFSPGDELELLLVWQENGQAVERWFDADQLEPADEVKA